jgi:prevent-host-death family protein
MNVYTYSEARRNLASVLDEAERDGEVRITRRDGRTFSLRPAPTGSPFDDVNPVSDS